MSRSNYSYLLCSIMILLIPVISHDSSTEEITLPFPAMVFPISQFPISPTLFRHLRSRSLNENELTPLYPGYGTHFSYVYVGTPPQRQSVIIDTGSHYTAFPCIGCKECGEHTDKYWDIKASSTARRSQCDNKDCELSQAYSEGSSWKAYQVMDKLWVGGESPFVVPNGNSYAINFTFGCQQSVTGLFKQQLADGIMGMSIGDDTLIPQLFSQGVIKNKIFALCFRVGGGIMTIGGVDPKIHDRKIKKIEYAKLVKTTGWFTVRLVDMQLVQPLSNEFISLELPETAYNSGKGIIVDSGTTDTYLPSAIAARFREIFKRITGVEHTISNIKLSADQVKKIPNLIFVFENTDGKFFQIEMPAANYLDDLGGGMYAFRVYVTESSGGVLGANFMTGFNIIFDQDNARVGFAPSTCKYQDFFPPSSLDPPGSGSDNNGFPPRPVPPADCSLHAVPVGPCQGTCSTTSTGTSGSSSGSGGDSSSSAKEKGYLAAGVQDWGDACGTGNVLSQKACHLPCYNGQLTRSGGVRCPYQRWSECSVDCTQSRVSSFWEEAQNTCLERLESRPCASGQCRAVVGDFILFLEMLTSISGWNYIYSEDFFGAFRLLFNIPESYMHMLVDSDGNEEWAETTSRSKSKLEIQIRLRRSEYKYLSEIFARSEAILAAVRSPGFSRQFIDALNVSVRASDSLDHPRYGWLRDGDLLLTNAMSLPVGETRDPINIPDIIDAIKVISTTLASKVEYFFIGTAIVAVTLLMVVVIMYLRLRSRHASLEKDKVGGSLREMWGRFRARRKQRRNALKPNSLELTSFLRSDNDDRLDEEDFDGGKY